MSSNINILELWENNYKPKVLSYKLVPAELIAEIFGWANKQTVYARIKSGEFKQFSNYTPPSLLDGDKYHRYEIYPLRFVKWYEGEMSV